MKQYEENNLKSSTERKTQAGVSRRKSFGRNLMSAFTIVFFLTIFWSFTVAAQTKNNSNIFIRFKILKPAAEKMRVDIGGFRHEDPWYFPNISVDAAGGAWSEWIDLSGWKWHGRLNRSGGIAEWNSVKLNVIDLAANQAVKGCSLDVQLSDAPDEKSAVVSFNEPSASNAIAFLVPYPLRENAKEFETGSQMTARHAQWAREATGGNPVTLKNFKFITQLWGHYDPNLERQEILTLKSLGFNIVGDISAQNVRETGVQTYNTTWIYEPDPDKTAQDWKTFADGFIASDDGKQKIPATAHWTISDEISALDFRSVEPAKLNGWFRDFLKSKGVTEKEIGVPINSAEYPAKTMYEATLNRDAPLETRRLLYYAAKFGQWWSAKQLRQTSDLIRQSFPATETQTLLPSHGFFGSAWGPAYVGMSYRNLDFFEVGAQSSVTQISVEDWLGLNHMYGPNYTWTGGQTFGYFNALARSAITDKPIAMRGLITPSDDDYLRLKAYSAIGQGAKSFFFWTFGPTYIGTENYWSDLRSEYDGIAKLSRSISKAEDVLLPAKTVSDPVAILYSVSHDIWNTDNQAAFVEKRLLWHGLRHLQIQPDFLREEDVENGRLKNYKVLYITDWCVSRKASAAIDEWVKAGGIVYLSAGAATRDEFDEPFTPPFAETVWETGAAQKLISEKHEYNERKDLPLIKPLTSAKINLNNRQFDLPVIGARSEMRPNAQQFAAFADGKTAGEIVPHGKGQIIAVGFLPMLAYGQLADFKPETLAEKWKPESREIIQIALDAGKISPVAKADVPVVETDFLRGASGSVVVLANYTYQPIDDLTIEIKTSETFKRAVSTEGIPIKMEQTKGTLRLELPLKWTDMILLLKE
ncbi:MAG: hypothetical protein ACR2N3_18795 [Pyrinomonadaceae bacterium]